MIGVDDNQDVKTSTEQLNHEEQEKEALKRHTWELGTPFEPFPVDQVLSDIDMHFNEIFYEHDAVCKSICEKYDTVMNTSHLMLQCLIPMFKEEQSNQLQELAHIFEAQERLRKKMMALIENTRKSLFDFMNNDFEQ